MPPRRASARPAAAQAAMRTAELQEEELTFLAEGDVEEPVDEDSEDYENESAGDDSGSDEGDEGDEDDENGEDDEVGNFVLVASADQQRAGEVGPPAPPPPRLIFAIPPYPQDNRGTRAYAGPLRKWDRKRALLKTIYGPRKQSLAIIYALCTRWMFHVLPRGLSPEEQSEFEDEADADRGADARERYGGRVLCSPWLPDNFEVDQLRAHHNWYKQYWKTVRPGNRERPQDSYAIPAEEGEPYLPYDSYGRELLALLGLTNGSNECQISISYEPQRCCVLESSGLPSDCNFDNRTPSPVQGRPSSTKKLPGVFMLDAGGVVLSLAWAPSIGEADQLLAIAAVPHNGGADTATGSLNGGDVIDDANEGTNAARTPAKRGSIQFWSMPFSERTRSKPHYLDRLPKLERVLCFDWGWPKRMQFCPVPLMDVDKSDEMFVYGMLAMLTEDGIVRVIEIKRTTAATTQYTTLRLLGEDDIYATCLTWVGINRIALGHSDGSITLWSIHPEMLQQRHPAYATQVLDICSGYPSHPYIVASRPVGGVSRLIDLSRPSSEHTFHPSPVVSFQRDLLCWSDHMQGFASISPSNNPLSGKLDFMHVRHYPCSRTFFPSLGSALPTCLSTSTVHPYALVGRADGSLWVCNMLPKVFPKGADVPRRYCVFRSEFRPPPPRSRRQPERHLLGLVRILQNAYEEPNEYLPVTGVGSVSKGGQGSRVSEDAEDEQEQEPGHTVIHDPLTRISAVAWNPNIEYGTWCAAAMASGLVRVMDLDVRRTDAGRQ